MNIDQRPSKPRALSNRHITRWVLLLGLALPTISAAKPSKPAQKDPRRLEVAAVPVLGGDSDIGFQFGAIASLARFAPGRHPYAWRIEVLASLSVKGKPGQSGVEFPFHDDYIKLDLPGLLGGRLRLNLELRFGRYSTSGYYGFGNGSQNDSALTDAVPRYYQYDRWYPRASVQSRITLRRRFFLLLGSRLIWSRVVPFANSLLERDITRLPSFAQNDPTRQLLRGTETHLLVDANIGLIYDTRDHEYAPTRGMFHEVSWRFSPGVAIGTDHGYGELNFTARYFRSLVGQRLVLAARAIVDLIFGQPPFYLLSEHAGLFPASSPGGGGGVRGVPLQRYHGKIKLLTNLELRSKLWSFTVFAQRINLGALAFVDLARIWADWRDTGLDGRGVGIKVGAGGGLRLQWGETFILAADVAWSPDAAPIGFYITVGHVF